ncbi:NAD-dependent epimerase/dehydratase family protein [Streptomyces glomeratus]|uniref:NAD-dependent epimerase/dehydratase family protein n=2 Tax=Streptomyces glomeratus TaxID=284452 RepID=A0ABP6LVT4_9ACTN
MGALNRMPTAAVLGSTGCVGRQVCSALSLRGYDVLGVARRHVPHTDEHKFAAVDVAAAEPERFAELLEAANVRVVVNATGGWHTSDADNEYSHVRLVDRLLQTLALLPGVRLVQVGTIHEYGPVEDGVAIDEAVVPAPVTAYARTKLAGTRAILEATAAGRLDAVVLRAVNVFGPYTTRASFLGSVVARLREARADGPVVLSVADARRDFVDARDLAEAVVAAVEAPVTGRVVNIGSGVATPIGELVSSLVSAAGLPPQAVVLRRADVRSKGGGWTQADIRLAARLLGWHPRTSRQDSMRAMWNTAEGA